MQWWLVNARGRNLLGAVFHCPKGRSLIYTTIQQEAAESKWLIIVHPSTEFGPDQAGDAVKQQSKVRLGFLQWCSHGCIFPARFLDRTRRDAAKIQTGVTDLKHFTGEATKRSHGSESDTWFENEMLWTSIAALYKWKMMKKFKITLFLNLFSSVWNTEMWHVEIKAWIWPSLLFMKPWRSLGLSGLLVWDVCVTSTLWFTIKLNIHISGPLQHKWIKY